MSDWKNQLNNVQNKIKQQFHAKKLDDLEFVYAMIKKFDANNTGILIKYDFEKFLSQIGIFLTSQELRAVYNFYDTKHDGNISYSEFLDFVRTTITEKRLAVIKHAFQFLDTKNCGKLEIEFLKTCYRAQQHPRVRTKQKSVEQVQQEFITAISKKSSDGKTLTEPEFLDYYADMNATLPFEKEDYFIDVLMQTWGISSSQDYVSPERLAQLEIILYEKIRQKTQTKIDEGKTAKKAFKFFDLLEKGAIDYGQFKCGLEKFGCVFSEKEIVSLFNKYDKDQSGLIKFDEFSKLYAQIGSGNVSITNPVFELAKQPPKELICKIKDVLKQIGEQGFRSVNRNFRRADINKNGVLDRNEFIQAMKNSNIMLSKVEYDKLFSYFDKNSDDEISYDEFLYIIRGDLNETRQAIIKQAFEKLDKDKKGVVTLETLKEIYDVSHHPDAKLGKRTPDEILKEFMAQWDTKEKDGIITYEEFEEYYKDISACIDQDELFVGIIKNAWKIEE